VYALFNVISGGTSIGIAEVTLFLVSSFVLGIIEIPMLCACYDWCRLVAKYTKPIAGLWVGRAAVHLLVGAGILALGVKENNDGKVRSGPARASAARAPPIAHSHTPRPHLTRPLATAAAARSKK
jgi:hypothetical protein